VPFVVRSCARRASPLDSQNRALSQNANVLWPSSKESWARDVSGTRRLGAWTPRSSWAQPGTIWTRPQGSVCLRRD